MEWDFKDFAWDSTQDHYDHHHQLEKKEETDLAALVGSSCRSGAAEPFNLVDLKLGNSEEVAPIAMKKLQNVPKSSPRNRRQLNNIRSDHHQNLKVSSSSPSCLVDNCKTDLSRCREYHRRHRVCELHSKTPIVTIRSQQKRFCQQCSRFHSLAEFDEVKRSCRKRLNGHNQRRRKPKPESFYFTSKNFLSAYKGPRILQFGSPQIYATTNVRSMWPLESKSAADHHPMLYSGHQRLHAIDHQRIPPNSFTTNEESDKQFIFLQKNVTKVGVFNQAAAAAAPHAFPQQPFPTISAAAASPQSTRATAGHAVSSDCTTRGIDPGCALYLLSSSYPTQSSMNTDPNCLDQSNLVTSSSYSGYTQIEMKSFSEFPSYCSNELVENKFFSEA